MKTTAYAYMLVHLIECQANTPEIQEMTENVIRDLGGNPNIAGTSPGATALYILALMLKP